MKTWNKLITLALFSTFAIACGDDGPVSIAENDDTEVFRAALVGGDDLEMEYSGEDGTRSQAIAGERSMVASLTADAVGGTNAMLVGHLEMMRTIAALPPTKILPDARIWEGEDKGIFYRVGMERSDTPRGTRFDYRITARSADTPDAEMLPLVDGDVVRIETRPEELGRQGFGIIRVHFENIHTVNPEEEIGGIARIAFRRVGLVRQVHTRMLNVHFPEDPEFPVAAEYFYTQLPNSAGVMKWFSVGDVQKDGPPFERVAVHSAWRADHSGIGAAKVFGGSLDVDYWHVGECWDSTFIKGFERIEVPGMSHETGDAATCFAAPANLDVPEFMETLADEDPALPGEHPEE